MTKLTKIIALATASLLASCSQSNDKTNSPLGKKKGPRPSPEKLFEKLDTDRSGGLSSNEFQARQSTSHKPSQEMIQKRFTTLDSNSDGQISLAELKAQPLRKKTR